MSTTEQPATSHRRALTRSNRRVLCALGRLIDREGSASIREIMAESGLRSSSSVAFHLNKLATYGFIEPPVRNRPRGWRLTRQGWIATGAP